MLVFKLPCCNHYVNTECFKTWAFASQKEPIVRCAYCTTTYPYEDACFLCLQEYTKKLNCTRCCHTKVHTECTADLTVLPSLLPYEHTLECRQLTECNRLCVEILNNSISNSYIEQLYAVIQTYVLKAFIVVRNLIIYIFRFKTYILCLYSLV